MNQAPSQSVAALEISGSRQFTSWLGEQALSLAFTTYQAGKLFLIGVNSQTGKLSIFERTFERCMGLCVQGNSLYMSTLYQLWRFENSLMAGQVYQDYDALYVPQMSFITGDLDIHDIVMASEFDNRHASIVQGGDKLVFVNTLFSCLGTTSETHSFTPLWRPPFISKLAAEDRCHLNGLALREGQPRYVSTVSCSDVADGWREHRHDGGSVIDVLNNEVIVSGLSMPHSPRWHQGKLWICNSGAGEFGYVDLEARRFEPITFCPGYLRGCAFYGDFAIVGLSLPRHNKTFSGLALDDRLKAKQAAPRCGLQVIDLRTGDAVHSLHIEGVVNELYDVAVIPGVCRPMAIGFRSDEIRRMISLET